MTGTPLPDPSALDIRRLTAQLVCPALRDYRGDPEARRAFLDGVERRGWGGAIVFGGDPDAVGDLLAEGRERAAIPLLIAGDFERGAGQQFPGRGTSFPPLMALAAIDDPAMSRSVGEALGRELRALGFHVDFWPVADLATEPTNPIVGTRAAGDEPERAGGIVAAVVEGLQSAGVAAAVKHFPGHGRTTIDSHEALPVVEADRETLEGDLVPFRSGIEAGAKIAMTAHVAFPALEPDGARDRPATFSPAVVSGLLREELGFGGLVCTDALMMGAVAGAGPAAAARRAVAAGVDWLLYPDDPVAVAEGLAGAIREGRLGRARVEESVARLLALKAWARCGDPAPSLPAASSLPLAEAVAGGALTARPPEPPPGPAWPDRAQWMVVLDGAIDPADVVLRRELAPEAGDSLLLVDVGADPDAARRRLEDVRNRCRGTWTVCAVFNPVRAWKGRAGLSTVARSIVEAACEAADEAVLILFSDPRIVANVRAPDRVVWAYGEDAACQRAAVSFLRGEFPARGRLPLSLPESNL